MRSRSPSTRGPNVRNRFSIHAGSPLADGSRIQRLIGELHGAQRQRLGWTETQLVREVEPVRDVCVDALRQTLGTDERAMQAAAALDRLRDERARACLSGFRGSAREPG